MTKLQIPSKFQIPNSKVRTAVFLLFLCVFGLFCGSAFAQQEGSKEEEYFFVARKAFDDGFYDVALLLLDRFEKNYSRSDKLVEVKLLIGKCYFHQGKLFEAKNTFEALLLYPASQRIKDEALYWIAEARSRLNNR